MERHGQLRKSALKQRRRRPEGRKFLFLPASNSPRCQTSGVRGCRPATCPACRYVQDLVDACMLCVALDRTPLTDPSSRRASRCPSCSTGAPMAHPSMHRQIAGEQDLESKVSRSRRDAAGQQSSSHLSGLVNRITCRATLVRRMATIVAQLLISETSLPHRPCTQGRIGRPDGGPRSSLHLRGADQ